MIKAVLWDVDGTLLNFLVSEEVAIRKCFEIFELGECSKEMLEEYSKINVSYWKALERGEMSKPQILVDRFRDFFKMYGLDESKADAFNAEYQIRLADTVCFEDNAYETLQEVRKMGIIQCAVTNGTRLAQNRKLKNSGLDSLLDFVFISEELGVEKPGIGFFDRAFGRMSEKGYKINKEEIMIVGDSLTSDIKGGNNAGIRTCLYDPSMKLDTEGFVVDYHIDNLSRVKDILSE